MKQITSIIAQLCLPGIVAISAAAADPAPSLEPLQGQWSTTKTNREGRTYSQVIDIKKDQLTLQIFNADAELRLIAKGTIKTQKAGPFEIFVLSNIQGGRSADDMQPVDDDRGIVYTLRDEKLFLASNFDKERQNERPAVDVYVRKTAAAATAGASSEGEVKLAGTWKLEFKFGENTLEYELRITKAGGQLAGVLVSPRTGEHKCKSLQFKDGEVVMEVEREIQGNQATFIYKGKLTPEGLSGKVTVKGMEDQLNGTWKASK